ncbi:MAG: PspC domain-containing protein [Nanoarchaeota archaeon]
MKRLYKSNKNKVIFGICGGIGEYYNIDPTIIRLLWIIITLISFGAGILVYIIAAFLIPKK